MEPEDLKRARALHPHWDDYEPLIKHMILQKLAAKPTDGAEPTPPKVRHINPNPDPAKGRTP